MVFDTQQAEQAAAVVYDCRSSLPGGVQVPQCRGR
jgi:hypothetical protein